MRFRACIGLLLSASSCATSTPSPEEPRGYEPRLANLQRAAALPWTDEGRCAVQEAVQPWAVVAERCFHALDHDRVEFHDTAGRCAVASAGAAVVGLGVCVLAAPEIVVGAVVVTGVVVVGVALKEALEAYELRRGRPQAIRKPRIRPETQSNPSKQRQEEKRPKPEPKGPDWPPLWPPGTAEQGRPECRPVPVKHLGGNALHDRCADRVPNNRFPGWDILVNGKSFDALQMTTRTLWEVKSGNVESYKPYVLQIEIEKQVKEAKRERALADACGYDFIIGVRSAAHKQLLESKDFSLKIIVMDWC
jgi:hypothetical protein